MQDMDTFAADIAARHAPLHPGQPDPATGTQAGGRMLVTAALDRFILAPPVDLGVLSDEATHSGQRSSQTGVCASVGHYTPAALFSSGLAVAVQDVSSMPSAVAFHGKSPALAMSHQRHNGPMALEDLHMVGHVTWTGRSTMEVTLQLLAIPLRPNTPHASSTACNTAESLPGRSHTMPSPAAASAPLHVGLHQAEGADESQSPPVTHASVVPHHSRPTCLLAMAQFVMASRDVTLKHAVRVAPLAQGSVQRLQQLQEVGEQRNR